MTNFCLPPMALSAPTAAAASWFFTNIYLIAVADDAIRGPGAADSHSPPGLASRALITVLPVIPPPPSD
eukprot:SAG11_NODE_4648_length_1821_cov_2.554588_2_plen_69_part_00